MTITFDTLKLAEKLETSGFSAEQAKGTAKALSEELFLDKSDLVTKEDLNEVRTELKTDINEIKTDLAVIKSELQIFKWIGGIILALLVKLVFFP